MDMDDIVRARVQTVEVVKDGKKVKVQRDVTALYCDEPSLTQQHFKEECDINEILRRSQVSGQLPVRSTPPMYGDFTAVPKSLEESFAMIKQANDLFMALPWEARERFGNNPEKMIAFLQDPRNREEAIRLGLVNKPAEKPAGEVEEEPPAPKAKAVPAKAKPVDGD